LNNIIERHNPPGVTGWLLGLWLIIVSSLTLAEHSIIEVDDSGVSGRLYVPADYPAPAVVVMGGSGGRLNHVFPNLLADQGFVVLSLAYFNAPGLPATLDGVPVETVGRALDYLARRPEVDQSAGLGVLGVSRGSELAMLAAIHDQRISAVAGVVPSSVAWHGQTGPVAWTVEGHAVPSLGFSRSSADAVYQRAEQALSTDEARQAEFAIERINGPVLLASSAKDQIWPSTRMSGELVRRATRHGVKDRVTHVVLNDDHGLDEASVQQLIQPLKQLFAVLHATD
jgi:dienelactone hydrolase